MKALKNNIVVGEVAVEKKTESGLILTQNMETGSRPAKVVAIGPDVTQVKIGEQIVIKWAEAIAVSENGQQYAIVSEDHVYGVFD